MQILLDQNNVGLFLGLDFTVTDTAVLLSDGGQNTQLNSSNTTVIDADVPQPPLSNTWKWQNNAWVCIDQAAVNAYNADQIAAFNTEQSNKRHATYVLESDPIFFKSQRGEATHQEWLDKIAEIDARYPYEAT